MEDLFQTTYTYAYSKPVPFKLHLDIALEVGTRLANELGANVLVVKIGTLLMDCMIGEAIEEKRIQEHVQMSLEKANEFLKESSITDKDKENIRQCILQHHGAPNFHSIESEIICNADCYRWCTVKGVIEGARGQHHMEFDEFINLAEKKVEEKWNALSLEICKKELKEEYEILKLIIKNSREDLS